MRLWFFVLPISHVDWLAWLARNVTEHNCPASRPGEKCHKVRHRGRQMVEDKATWGNGHWGRGRKKGKYSSKHVSIQHLGQMDMGR